RRVAIKVLMEAQADQVALKRFRRECQAVASLDHRNIVRAHDFDSDGKFHYLVMEFVDGPSLDILVEQKGTLPPATVADYISQAAKGLHHAHLDGMVHRDMKPSNLLLDPKGIVKVLDMGVARITSATDDSLTLQSNQTLLGTIDYLAPEQALNSHDVDVRADVYSLGCTFYFLAAGRPPFPDGVQAQKLLAHQMQKPQPLAELRPDMPEALIAVGDRMMEKKPEDRQQTMLEVVDELDPWTDSPKNADDKNALEASQKSNSISSPTAETQSNAGRPTVTVSDSMIRVVCGGCHTAFGAPMKAANRRVRCPKCGYPIFIPPPKGITGE
ncbi:MAG: protein kinase, partial [Planctomycetales bacterium]